VCCFGLVFSEIDASDEVVGSGLLPATSEGKKKNTRRLNYQAKVSGTAERSSPIRLFNRWFSFCFSLKRLLRIFEVYSEASIRRHIAFVACLARSSICFTISSK